MANVVRYCWRACRAVTSLFAAPLKTENFTWLSALDDHEYNRFMRELGEMLLTSLTALVIIRDIARNMVVQLH